MTRSWRAFICAGVTLTVSGLFGELENDLDSPGALVSIINIFSLLFVRRKSISALSRSFHRFTPTMTPIQSIYIYNTVYCAVAYLSYAHYETISASRFEQYDDNSPLRTRAVGFSNKLLIKTSDIVIEFAFLFNSRAAF